METNLEENHEITGCDEWSWASPCSVGITVASPGEQTGRDLEAGLVGNLLGGYQA